MTTTDPGNGKVTLAIIQTQLDGISKTLNAIDSKLDRQDDRLRELETGKTRNETNITTLQNDVDDLRKKSERWDVTNSILALIAAILGGLGIGRQ